MLSQLLRAYAFTTIFCISIAVVLWQLKEDSLSENLIISFCIGLSICTAYVLLNPVLNTRFARLVSSTLIAAIGLAIGLLLAGIIARGELFFYLTATSSALLLGVFFGVIGIIIYISHTRLVELQAELALACARESMQAQQAAETQLQLLQAQIEPHFLFNTLSNVVSLIQSQPEQAEATLVNLTILLRHSLNRTRKASIVLGEEIDIIQAYLDIQQIRMGERLTFTIDVPESLKTLSLPPLLLQPLVENCVLHGLNTAQGGHITIKAFVVDGSFCIEVIDTGIGIGSGSGPAREGHGTGLANVRARINGLFGKRATLVLSENTPTGVIARLNLPVDKLS